MARRSGLSKASSASEGVAPSRAAEPPPVTDYYRRHYEQQLKRQAGQDVHRYQAELGELLRIASQKNTPHSEFDRRLLDEEGI
jgi:hypothetical protein